jgi:hypothetical protein
VKTSIKIEKKWKKLPELAKEKGLFEWIWLFVI